ncbi:hypothetical protein [uncultured Shewanella sp.]|uniref:alpha/beta hydrolase family protein n=1 Tax=uncultured Shewanella sp. TaxID=173975 RepID=UPI0026185582|nr:hypothetical protein [uncultured Shewanella sp.]
MAILHDILQAICPFIWQGLNWNNNDNNDKNANSNRCHKQQSNSKGDKQHSLASIKQRPLIVDIHENRVQANPYLVIAIHGDVPFGPVSYHNTFAKQLSEATENVVVGLLRPGYKDDKGRRSVGRKGWSVGDNYDFKRIESIVHTIQALQQQYQPIKTIVAGHSGGAAITAKMLAYYSNLMDVAFIVSCPTDINVWRSDMLKLSFNPLFIGKLNRVSPMDLTDKVSTNTHVHVFCGVNDPITLPYLSERYVAKLTHGGKNVRYDAIEGDHNIFLHPFILRSVVKQITN